MADILRWAIVGTGMGRNRARMVTNTPGAQLVAICSLDEERGRKMAEELQCEFVGNYDDLLARDDVDVVGVMTPSGWHCDHAIQAMRAGKHVHTTKPMDIRVEKCDEAIRVAKETGKVFGVDFDSRYSPINHQIRQAVRSGRLGKVFMGDVRMKWYRAQSYYDGGVPAGWRSRRETEGGSAANQGVHYIDLLQWWLGPVKTVQGRIGTFTHNIETEDNANALLTFESGAWGIIQTSTSNYPDLGTTIELSGERGTIRWNDNTVSLFKVMDEEESSLNDYAVDPDLPKNIIADMIAAITQGRPLACPPEEGRKSVAIFCAIYESARTGKVVELS